MLSKLLITFLPFPTPQDCPEAFLLYFSGFIFHQKADTSNHTKHSVNCKSVQTWIWAAHLILFPSNKSRQTLFTSVSIWSPSILSILIRYLYSSCHLVLIKRKPLLRFPRLTHKDRGKWKQVVHIHWPHKGLLSFSHLSFPLHFHRCLQDVLP